MPIKAWTDTPASALRGMCVLVTRPAHQAQALREMIEAQGGQVMLFPVLEISATVNVEELMDLVIHLDDFDIAIFISGNAVVQGLSFVLARRSLPLHLQLATVGQRTARELEQFGLCADICPQDKFNSEALLELAEMQEVRDKNIVIFRGEGGREFLADTLRARGAHVEYANVYRRACPAGDSSVLVDALLHNKIDMITVTSNEGLSNLFDMAGSAGQAALLQVPLTTISQRIAALAVTLGFQSPATVSTLACDESLVEAVINALSKGKDTDER